jgi:hypothetical protein
VLLSPGDRAMNFSGIRLDIGSFEFLRILLLADFPWDCSCFGRQLEWLKDI